MRRRRGGRGGGGGGRGLWREQPRDYCEEASGGYQHHIDAAHIGCMQNKAAAQKWSLGVWLAAFWPCARSKDAGGAGPPVDSWNFRELATPEDFLILRCFVAFLAFIQLKNATERSRGHALHTCSFCRRSRHPPPPPLTLSTVDVNLGQRWQPRRTRPPHQQAPSCIFYTPGRSAQVHVST